MSPSEIDSTLDTKYYSPNNDRLPTSLKNNHSYSDDSDQQKSSKRPRKRTRRQTMNHYRTDSRVKRCNSSDLDKFNDQNWNNNYNFETSSKTIDTIFQKHWLKTFSKGKEERVDNFHRQAETSSDLSSPVNSTDDLISSTIKDYDQSSINPHNQGALLFYPYSIEFSESFADSSHPKQPYQQRSDSIK